MRGTRLEATVADDEAGERLDRWLAATFDELSRRAARRLLERGAVWVDGQRIRVASRAVKAGQDIVVVLEAPPKKVFTLDEARVLFEDEWLLAVDKPAGVPAQATPGDAQSTVRAAAERYLRGHGEDASVHLPHRLDRGTSGVQLLAKGPQAAHALGEIFRERAVEKVYEALSSGHWRGADKEIVVEDRLEKQGRTVVSVFDGGRRAETAVRLVNQLAAGCHLEARPRTGRQHQVRVHLADLGLPILGDRLYGPRPEPGAPRAPRMMLHARSLAFAHPFKKSALEIESPLPDDFAASLEGLGASGSSL
ncbi:MAG: RluA family pseudouridine synthase [Acidobacteriota bacterium]